MRETSVSLNERRDCQAVTRDFLVSTGDSIAARPGIARSIVTMLVGSMGVQGRSGMLDQSVRHGPS